MKSAIYVLLMIFAVSLIPLASSQTNTCDLDASMINQDPYPSVPGDRVKVVFQVTGVSDRDCGEVSLEFDEQFPFSLEPGQTAKQTIQGGTYISTDFASFWLVPFELRVADNALEGDNVIKVNLDSSTKGLSIKNFTINVEDLTADFEISIKDYEASTNTLTFEILNIGESDIDALTIDIPKQPAIEIKGASRNIVGDLDANEDTTFTFEAIPSNGEIELQVLYTDQVNVRRALEKTVVFDSSYFTGRIKDQKSVSPWIYVLIVVIVLIVIFWIRNRLRKKKNNKH